MKSNRVLGLGGFTIKFCKTFHLQICPYLEYLFAFSFQNNCIPDSWETTKIILIPKIGFYISKLESYRTISLLNTDYKLLTNNMDINNKMSVYSSDYIHRDI